MTEELNTMAEKPELLSEAAHQQLSSLRHEMSNTLYSIWLQARCARLGLDEDRLDQVRRSLEQIERAVEETQNAADQIVDVTRPRA